MQSDTPVVTDVEVKKGVDPDHPTAYVTEVVTTKELLPAPVDPPKNIPPKTTAEQDLKSKGQRQINRIWEYTQSYVAITVVSTTALGMFIGRMVEGSIIPFPAEWWTIVGLVIGFYFGRTNHARVGDDARPSGADWTTAAASPPDDESSGDPLSNS